MAKIGIVFSADYELFGNGTGDVQKCMINPTNEMAKILGEEGVCLTLFVDVCELWAFETEYNKGKLSKDWAKLIKDQVRDLVENGHDVQLHLHPQWLNYSFNGSKWELDFNLWRIGLLKYEDLQFPNRSLKSLFQKGKETLEMLIRPVNPNYICNVFRAGAWSMQPETDVLRAMKECGFMIDSTVAPGMQFDDETTFYDFNEAPDRASWKIRHNLLKAEEHGILEVPIFTTSIPIFQKIKFFALKRLRSLNQNPIGCDGIAKSTANKSKFEKIKNVLTSRRNMFNFSDATSSEEMIYFARRAIKKYRLHPAKEVPVVAIAHPKSFANETELRKFVSWIKHHDSVVTPSSYQAILTKMNEKNSIHQ